MYEAKTKPTSLTFTSYLVGIQDPSRREDCEQVAVLMEKVTGCKPQMWGTSIVGFDQYHYKYASGHEGDSAVTGFSSRKKALTIYLMGIYGSTDGEGLLEQLGKYKSGKACLYITHLADVDVSILEKLIRRSVDMVKQRYPTKKS
jgi:hypothetical protein